MPLVNPSSGVDLSPVYRRVHLASSRALNSGAATLYLGFATHDTIDADNSGKHVFWFDPADHAVSGKSTVVRVRGIILVNAVAPAATFTFGLYPVTSVNGGSGSGASIHTVGAAIATAAVASPGASAATKVDSADTAAPVAGLFVLGMVVSTGVAAGNAVEMIASLDVRNV